MRVQRAIANIEVDPIEHGPTAYDMAISSAIDTKVAMFDARIFIIPEAEEVVNYFVWRQQDATRNSISMSAQSMFSHKELQKKSSSDLQEMMFTLKGVNWNDYPTRFKRGTAIVKIEQKFMAKDFKFSKKKGADGLHQTTIIDPSQVITRNGWGEVETPIFTQDREFIKKNFVKSVSIKITEPEKTTHE